MENAALEKDNRCYMRDQGYEEHRKKWKVRHGNGLRTSPRVEEPRRPLSYKDMMSPESMTLANAHTSGTVKANGECQRRFSVVRTKIRMFTHPVSSF